MPLVDQFYNGGIKYYVNTHEQNCGHAATGYAKVQIKWVLYFLLVVPV